LIVQHKAPENLNLWLGLATVGEKNLELQLLTSKGLMAILKALFFLPGAIYMQAREG
jgi:hypothetical protein